ncbi:putative ankyrin repeat protein RF_0381 [Lytechinus variegatus]|uniref:putative ankyrin repeat protein RF_0381 n=1 Tax=Lytechinus variegatus TaxID=7654 RepID=UPI001BB27B80|nr:putative ankyrin repeat protein RF_0381 [Lytechinus variegatus]
MDNDGWTALHRAAKNGHTDVIEYLICKGAEVNKEDNYGFTALHRAANNGHIDVIKYLISEGAEFNKVDNDGLTALHHAANNGHIDVIKYLISGGAEVNKVDNDGLTALHRAVWNGHIDVIKYLFSEGAEVNKEDNDGLTALHHAANIGHIDVIYLISEKADINKVDNDGQTALHHAANNGHIDISKYLINGGAEVNKEDNNGETALHIAAKNGRIDFIKYLISEGGEVNKEDNDERTALHNAAENGNIHVVKHLISQRCDVNKGDKEGTTALHIAVQNGYTEVVKVLLTGGARCDTEDIHGQTPLHQTITLGYRDIADVLVDNRDAKSDSVAIHLAVMHGHTSIIERMIAKRSDINVQSNDGQTCLHKAIKLCYQRKRNVEDTETLRKVSEEYYSGRLSPEKALVFYLLENRARIDIKDEAGCLPIHYANDEMIRQMILARSPSLDGVQSTRDRPSNSNVATVKVIRNSSQEINLEDHGISMYLPPGAVPPDVSCQITLSIIRENTCVITEGESMACYGIKCDPQPLIFNQPVKITIPHSSLVVNPEQVKPDIVCRVWDSIKDLPKTLRKQSSSSPDTPPYCRLYERHLELYIGHCAEWWVLIPLEQQVIRQQLICTPYVPDRIERGQEFAVNLQLCNDLPGNEAATQEESRQQSYHRCHRSVPFNVETKAGDVTITCHREGGDIESQGLGTPCFILSVVDERLGYFPKSEDKFV